VAGGVGRVGLFGLLVVVLHGCGDEDPAPLPLAGETITITGPELENELGNISGAFDPFEEETGAQVVVLGDPVFEESIGEKIRGGNPPDIALFPQPGLIEDLADEIVPLRPALEETVRRNYDEGARLEHVTVGDHLLGIPASADLKSLVWYSPRAFAEDGYEIPTTLAQFEQLAQRMADDGRVPFCLGLESAVATGWPLTDWIEDYVLRQLGPDVYDDWWRHDIPFDDPAVVGVAEHVVDFLSQPGFVYEDIDDAATRPTSEAGLPVLSGDCMMYRMAHFQGRYWPVNTDIGEDGDVDAFYLPGLTPDQQPALTGGTYAAAFSDRRAVRATMEYIASERYALERARTQPGFVSPNQQVDPDIYPTVIDSYAADVLGSADVVRYDASDLMPGSIGADLYWDAAVDITQGDVTVADAFAQIDDEWPSP
jgi:alpha-glucoside transport system substrate-binding protein